MGEDSVIGTTTNFGVTDYGRRNSRALTSRWEDDDDIPVEERAEEWSSVCFHFTQSTTFHGINKVTESTPFILRRIIWVLIVLGGMTLFVNQMIDSVLHYMDRPVTVNIKINYNKTVKFPAITICNQNVFRTTEAASKGHYFLIDTIFSKEKHGEVNLTELGAQDVTMLDLYHATGHDKHDLIVSCLWDQSDCGPEDFVTKITDHGLCYTFNSGRNGSVRSVTQTGSDKGLSLRLNVEQYEYMHGPNSAAGVKILVHEQDEIPMVRELGQAISPGSHAFVGIQMLQINNLQPPYGECRDDKELQYVKHYTIPGCLVDCREIFLVDQCKCREAYMPEKTNHEWPPVCTLVDYQDCMPKAYNLFNAKDEKLCECPVPCQRKMYETTISYAQTSKFDTRRHQRDANTVELQEKFVKAMETVQRVDSVIAARDFDLVKRLSFTAKGIVATVNRIEHIMKNVSKSLDQMTAEMGYRINFHDFYGLRVVERAVMYGFVQAWDIEQQSTFEPLAAGTIEFLTYYRKAILRIINSTQEEASFRKMLEWNLKDKMSTRKELIRRARQAMKKVHNAFIEGKTLIDYQWGISKRYDNLFVSKELLNHRKDYQSDLYEEMDVTLRLLDREILILKNHMLDAFRTGYFNHTLYDITRKEYADLIENFNYVYNLFKDAIVHRTKILIDERRNAFRKMNETLYKESGDCLITIHQSLDLVETMRVDTWPNVQEVISHSLEYTGQNHLGNKTSLANMVTSETIHVKLQQMHDFFNDVRARARNFDHDWKKYMGAYIKAWTAIKTEDTTEDFYQELHRNFVQIKSEPNSNNSREILAIFASQERLDSSDPDVLYMRTNADLAPINASIALKELKEYFYRLLRSSNIATVVNERDDKFFEAMDDWIVSLRRFLDECKTDESFFKENILEIDVFMKELYYEQVEQRIAYDLTNLWSDIGGSMGLFVGASVITVFELCDAIIHNFLKMQIDKNRRKKRAAGLAKRQNGKV